MTDEVAVTWSVDGPVMTIVLQRGPANALGLPIIEGIGAALDAADAAGASVVVVTSALPKFFAAGADIKLMAEIDAAGFMAYGDQLRAVLDRLAARVSIAAVEGVALGGGLELAMACCLRVAGTGASFGLPEVRLGLIPGAGGTQRLPRLVGRGRALDIMMTARQVPADEALAMGLVDRVVEAGQAEPAALRLAATLCQMSQPALAAVIATVDAAFDLPMEDGLQFEVDAEQKLFEDGDAMEGIAAFVAKRTPDFSRSVR
jgi:enoyl-CoA hydratase